MDDNPGLTNLAVGMILAYHQMTDDPEIFDDPLAARMINMSSWMLEQYGVNRLGRDVRLLVAATRRFADESIACAVDAGTRQVVLFNSGLSTFPYRNPHPDTTVFELGSPAALEWKRPRLADAGIAIPPNVRFVATTPEYRGLGPALTDAGFDMTQPSCMLALSTLNYLTTTAQHALFELVGALTAPADLVFDYLTPPGLMSSKSTLTLKIWMDVLSDAGEPWTGFFTPHEITALLRDARLPDIEDLDSACLMRRYLAGEPESESGFVDSQRIVHAANHPALTLAPQAPARRPRP